MFTGKVYINRNGKVLEKEFTTQEEYRQFLKEQNVRFPSFDFDEFPSLSLGGWSHFHNYLNDLIDQRVNLPFWSEEETQSTSSLPNKSGSIDFSDYEKELQNLEMSQTDLKSQLQDLKSDYERLENIRNNFISHGKEESDDLMKRLENDLKKVKEEIKSLEKKLKK